MNVSFRDIQKEVIRIPIIAFDTITPQLENGLRFSLPCKFYLHNPKVVLLTGKRIIGLDNFHFILSNDERRRLVKSIAIAKASKIGELPIPSDRISIRELYK